MSRLFSLILVVALSSPVPIHAQPKDPPKNFTDSIGMKFVWIPPGNFMMGNAKKERFDSYEDATQRKVTLTKGFYMGVYTVTQEQWQEIMGKNPSHFKGKKNLPVETVSWDDCQEFIKKLRDKEKKPYRLPTEAEWEYACRAGTTTPFHFGETISTDQANYRSDGKKGNGREKTMPVGSFPANAWGLHDMHGNVWQWCKDWFLEPKKEVVGNLRVLRGGSWNDGLLLCRSAYRHGDGPDRRAPIYGFRLCFCEGVAESNKVTAAWLKEVAAVPAEKQVEAVAAKLRELNPRFDGRVTPTVEKGVVTGLTFKTDAVTDISPVQALTGLRTLNCAGNRNEWIRMTDLSPLKGMKLTSLNCDHTWVADLSPLKDMKLTTLICSNTQVADLSPLKDMKLTTFICSNTKVADLSPLKDMKLTHLDCGVTTVTDLSPLKDMKLTTLECWVTQVSDLSPLRDMRLSSLNCSLTLVSDLSPLKGMKLTTLQCFNTKVSDLSPLKDMKLASLNCSNTQVSDLSPLKSMKLTNLDCSFTQVADLSPLKDMKLTNLDCSFTKVTDLSPLKDIKLTTLKCNNTEIADLSPLKDMKLINLYCFRTQIDDLSPLKGMKLEDLKCGETQVSDLSPLKDMKLTSLDCNNTKVSDLSPLKNMKLTHLACGHTMVADLSPLKAMKLTSLGCGFTQVAELLPLKDMKLTKLECQDTQVADLSPLQDMKLEFLLCHNTNVADLSPLQDMPLKILSCDFKPERDAEVLRSIKTLATINDKPAKEILKQGGAESNKTTAAWLKQVAAMPAEKQVEAVIAKLKELNPGFDGKVTHKIEKGVVTELTLVTNAVTDISPVQALTGLRTLVCSSMQIADLSPLKDMKLTTLNCAATKVADLLPLKDMKLTSLICNHTEVSDLSPLKDMNLERLICNHTKVGDLSPLKDMKLEHLDCGYTQVADLSPLKDMKLTTLNCAATMVVDLSPLKDMKLANLFCYWTQVADLSSLKDMKLTSLDCHNTKVGDLSPLKDMKLDYLDCSSTDVADLSPLKDMKLTNLLCGLTQVVDLSPLQDMKLTHLDCSYSKVADLSALKGMKLTSLFCNNTEVADLSPLKNTKLTILLCEKTKVADLSPLTELPLQELGCDFKSERDAEILRSIKTLETINGQPAKEFLKENPPKNFTNAIGMKFVWLAPGNFMMGSAKEEQGRGDNETQHKVTLTKGYYMSVHTVTQEQWQAVMGDNPSNFKGEKNLPVESVNWDDCQGFIKKLREKDEKPYRLPTEAEWECACRAGTTTPFHFGETISTDQANYRDNGEKGVYRKKTTPVGSFPANAWGLHDMHGNVWQWCQDRIEDYPLRDVVDPQGPEKGEVRVLRGGSWSDGPQSCRSAFRSGIGRAFGIRGNNVGFRLCFFVD